jgi:hypothetical protein
VRRMKVVDGTGRIGGDSGAGDVGRVRKRSGACGGIK